MNTLTIVWLALPFFVGFLSYLLPQGHAFSALLITLSSLSYGLWQVFSASPLSLELLDHFGISLMVDSSSGFFILTNALVTATVIFYCWQTGKTAFFYTQIMILHGSINAIFITADLISVYVGLEVVSIAGFLLMTYPLTDRSIWVGLRYLFISNTAMLFYLIGSVLVYQSNHSFAFTGLEGAPPEAIALIFFGLFTKGGIFISGLWLPLTHSEAETPVSALLSGIVIKAGIFPLIRCALLVEDLGFILSIFGLASALLGVIYAIFEKDTKRTLALSTISQLGFVISSPIQAGFYALTHGLAKSTLFLVAGNLPSRDFSTLRQTPISQALWIPLTLGSLSTMGFPLLAGFGSKALVLKGLTSWQEIGLTVSSIGTTIALSKFVFLPHQSDVTVEGSRVGLWCALGIPLLGLAAANSFHLEVYTLTNIGKALTTVLVGLAVYGMGLSWIPIKLPSMMETFEYLIGLMTVMITILFWMVAS
jgi:multicomponent Na+:H+ antiporter subunit D